MAPAETTSDNPPYFIIIDKDPIFAADLKGALDAFYPGAVVEHASTLIDGLRGLERATSVSAAFVAVGIFEGESERLTAAALANGGVLVITGGIPGSGQTELDNRVIAVAGPITDQQMRALFRLIASVRP